jgi:hypothetical protein
MSRVDHTLRVLRDPAFTRRDPAFAVHFLGSRNAVATLKYRLPRRHEGREVARRSKSNLAFFFAQLRVLRAFAVAHLKMGHGATKRRGLGKSSRGEKSLQDINEDDTKRQSRPPMPELTGIRVNFPRCKAEYFS